MTVRVERAFLMITMKGWIEQVQQLVNKEGTTDTNWVIQVAMHSSINDRIYRTHMRFNHGDPGQKYLPCPQEAASEADRQTTSNV